MCLFVFHSVHCEKGYVRAFVCNNVKLLVYERVLVRMCVSVCACTYVYVCERACVYVCDCVCVCMYVSVRVC